MASRSTSGYHSNLKATLARFKKARQLAVLGAAQEWRNGIVTLMSDSDPSGRIYPVPDTERYYRASAPGEPPAIREGIYRASFKAVPVPSALGEAAKVGTNAVQALALEKGYPKRGLEPRPHMREGYEHNRDGVVEALTRRWDRADIGSLIT